MYHKWKRSGWAAAMSSSSLRSRMSCSVCAANGGVSTIAVIIYTTT